MPELEYDRVRVSYWDYDRSYMLRVMFWFTNLNYGGGKRSDFGGDQSHNFIEDSASIREPHARKDKRDGNTTWTTYVSIASVRRSNMSK